MSEIEGLGEVATGALVARAVEPRTGEHADGNTAESHCLNCGEPLVGPYCARCGQRAHVHRTIGAWWHDFQHSVLHLDGKFWPTLGMLVWRPGDLTRRYAQGERAKFVSPLALFLFTVFLMFAVFSTIGGPFERTASADSTNTELASEMARLRDRVEDLEKRQSKLVAEGQPSAEVAAQLTEAKSELEAIGEARSVVLVPNAAPNGKTRTFNFRKGQIDSGWPWLDSVIDKARKNPDLLLYKLQANAYKFSWALILISLPFLWALFLHRRRYRRQFTGYDHLVFVTYSIAFMSMARIVFALIEAVGLDGGVISLGFLLIPPAHMYRQLRGAYGLSRMSAAWRTVALLLFAGLALAMFAMLLLAIGTLG